ncbi:hypothetical protein BJ742DRAFT_291860 [Cladochytrium replicatum]|nr:hypothetical protein BJ742DRAFT_291860 [Cladochytrium replicatum]
MAKRRNTTSRKNTENHSTNDDVQGDNQRQQKAGSDNQDQPRDPKQRGRPRSKSRSSSNGASLSYAALLAVALVIGSALFYPNFQGSSAIAPLRQPRAPHLGRRTVFEFAVGSTCEISSHCEVCLSETEFGRCNEGKITREGIAPGSTKCQKDRYAGCDGVKFV